jgi:nucleoside 2-deoxyribosyltransferase
MEVYLSVPMIANRAIERAQIIAKAIEDSGHHVSSPWVLGPIETSNPAAVNVFQRDRDAAERSDVLVADVTEPSTGVGMEIMAAFKAGRRVILVVKRGKVTSRMLQHMDGKEILEYELESEIYERLRSLLSKA